MKEYQNYLEELSNCLRSLRSAPQDGIFDDVESHLNGRAYLQLRTLIPQEQLRAYGAFFTGTSLADELVAMISNTLTKECFIADPFCGAGDLLLSVWRNRIASNKTFDPTNQLGGRDVVSEFIRAAKLRLTLATLRNCSPHALSVNPSSFKYISVGCGLKDTKLIARATHILMNPPYFKCAAPPNCEWANGRVTAAASYTYQVLSTANEGTIFAAILPEVLRSGTRYRRWRDEFASLVDIRNIISKHQFDKQTDVHVFLITGKIRRKLRSVRGRRFGIANEESQTVVGDKFNVSVGPVVDFRDPESGPYTPYVVARGLATWTTVNTLDKKRRFSGRLIQTPFVVVRRTSRPGDKYRAVGTIIGGKQLVAVDNHLLVVTPIDGTLRACKVLLRNLKDDRTTAWLDRTIRCRHLTTTSLKDLPWWVN